MTVNIEELRKLLSKEINEAFESSMDKDYSDVFELITEDLEIKGYSITFKVVNKGRWISDGKYETVEDAVVKLVIDNVVFFANVGQSRSGSSFTDFYYNEPYLGSLLTEEEYNAPTIEYTFEYKGKKVNAMSNKTAQVDSKSFPSIEAAIDSVLSGVNQ